ncbi:MAG TPA: VOC family protein [Acidimicrobiales bacterium]
MPSDDDTRPLVRDRYPAGVPCWIDLEVDDVDAATDFYGGLFGWTWEERVPAGVPASYRIARLGDHVVAAVGTPAPPGEPGSEWTPPKLRWNTYVSVSDVEVSADLVAGAGGTVLTAPHDVNVAGRTAAVADPAGAVLHLWQPGHRQGVELANAPGSWNWSNLSSPDPNAPDFYRQVFGWEARPVDLGGGGRATLFALPGYGDFLATLEPDIQERQAEQGAPEGFADAVAWFEPAAPGSDPEWTVTFAVADTDAATARAVELGATVVVPPFAAGPARVATITDPLGATLTLSTWSPTT